MLVFYLGSSLGTLDSGIMKNFNVNDERQYPIPGPNKRIKYVILAYFGASILDTLSSIYDTPRVNNNDPPIPLKNFAIKNIIFDVVLSFNSWHFVELLSRQMNFCNT